MLLPEYTDIKIRQTQDRKPEVLDVLRQRYVALTPEEWVRQHFVNYLIHYKGYPPALMGNEVELCVGNKKLRCDSVLYGKDRQPLAIMEYKAESIPIDQKVITQVATYNMLLHVPYLMVSNGNQHICLHFDKGEEKWEYLPDIPDYKDFI